MVIASTFANATYERLPLDEAEEDHHQYQDAAPPMMGNPSAAAMPMYGVPANLGGGPGPLGHAAADGMSWPPAHARPPYQS
jgi:hypothetical protein